MNYALVFRPVVSLRATLCHWLETIAKPFYVRLAKWRQAAWGHNMATLQTFPEGSLGKDIYYFLKENGLEMIPKCELHDVFHVLFDCAPTVEEEVRLQMILLGNGRKTLYTWWSVVIGGLLYPEYWRTFRSAYRFGQRCRPVHRWNFQYLLAENTAELRYFIQNRQFPDPEVVANTLRNAQEAAACRI
jgi:ubiquinone biosynthesis protein Coq4